MRSNHRRIRRVETDGKSLQIPTSSASAKPGNTNGDGPGGSDGAGGTGNDNGNGSTDGAHSASQSTQTTASVTKNGGGGEHHSSFTKQVQSTTTTSSEPPLTTTKTTSSSTTTSATSSATSLSVSVHASPSSHSVNNAKVTGPANPATGTTSPVNGDVATQPVLTTAPGTTVSAGSTNVAAAGSVNVGAVVGGVAGGIAGVAVIFFIVMYLLRRRRERGETFDPVSFRKSAIMVNDSVDPFNPRPPTMIERHVNGHNVAPSISSIQAANMAGAGAYSAYGHEAEEQQQYDAQAYIQAHQAPSQSQGHQPLQPRQQYTYGQSYGHDTYAPEGSDHGHGAEYNGPYSSEPQTQDIYAAEAYAYPGEDQVVVSPGMHAQEMGHYQQTRDAYGGM